MDRKNPRIVKPTVKKNVSDHWLPTSSLGQFGNFKKAGAIVSKKELNEFNNRVSLRKIIENSTERQRELILLTCDLMLSIAILHELSIPFGNLEKFKNFADIRKIRAYNKKDKLEFILKEVAENREIKKIGPKFVLSNMEAYIGRVNSVCVNVAQLVQNGPKDTRSVFEKSQTRIQNRHYEEIDDVARLTICLKDPNSVDLFNEGMIKMGMTIGVKNDGKWIMTPTGMLKNSTFPLINELPAEIQFNEEGQFYLSMNETHKIYEVMRIMGIKDESNTEIDFLKITEKYNEIATKYGLEEISSVNEINKNAIYEKLEKLHKKLHIEAMKNANNEWKKLYVKKAILKNIEKLDKGNPIIFTDTELKLIVGKDYDEIVGSIKELNKNKLSVGKYEYEHGKTKTKLKFINPLHIAVRTESEGLEPLQNSQNEIEQQFKEIEESKLNKGGIGFVFGTFDNTHFGHSIMIDTLSTMVNEVRVGVEDREKALLRKKGKHEILPNGNRLKAIEEHKYYNNNVNPFIRTTPLKSIQLAKEKGENVTTIFVGKSQIEENKEIKEAINYCLENDIQVVVSDRSKIVNAKRTMSSSYLHSVGQVQQLRK
jgi:cytidyltransferase-like protein